MSQYLAFECVNLHFILVRFDCFQQNHLFSTRFVNCCSHNCATQNNTIEIWKQNIHPSYEWKYRIIWMRRFYRQHFDTYQCPLMFFLRYQCWNIDISTYSIWILLLVWLGETFCVPRIDEFSMKIERTVLRFGLAKYLKFVSTMMQEWPKHMSFGWR